VLKLSFKGIVLQQKKELTEASNETIKLAEDELHELYEIATNSTETKFDDIVALATSYCNISIVYKNQTSKKKLAIAQNYLHLCLTLLKGKETDRKAVLIVMRAYVQMLNIFLKLHNAEKVYEYLHKGIALYLKYTKEDKFLEPLVINSVSLDIEDKEYPNSMLSLLSLYSECLIEANRLNIFEGGITDFVITIHNFLVNRCNIIVTARPIEESALWMYAMTDVAMHLLTSYYFTEVRNCFAATHYILDIYDKELAKLMVTQNCLFEDIFDSHYYTICGRLSKSWGNYGNILLDLSKHILLYGDKLTKKRARKIYKSKSTAYTSSKTSEEYEELLPFTNLEEHLTNYIDKITDKCVSNLDEAKSVFVFTMKWFEAAKTYFTKARQRILYCEAVYYMSRTYKHLAFFEPDTNNQIKLYKRQMHLLQDICNSGSDDPDSTAIFLDMSFELIILYAILLDMIIEDTEIICKPFTEIRMEIDTFVINSIKCYKFYLNYVCFQDREMLN
jgi:hypothetical protein